MYFWCWCGHPGCLQCFKTVTVLYLIQFLLPDFMLRCDYAPNILNKSSKQNHGSLGDEMRLKPGVLVQNSSRIYYSILKSP